MSTCEITIYSIKRYGCFKYFLFQLGENFCERSAHVMSKMSRWSCNNRWSGNEEMRYGFYTKLYDKEQCDERCVQDILEDLPQLCEVEQAELDKEISLEELTIAVNQLASGRAPGIDGLTIDFYKHFWAVIGPDLHEVLMRSYDDNVLPASCRRAVLTLLPKKGDLMELKNWRPVALLCTDYKVLSRALSSRLKPYIGLLVHMDQTYCIPDRTIMDNLFLMRDVMDVCNVYNQSVGILSLDQEKAFDRIDHDFLFSVFKAFGFGEKFIAWVSLLYSNASCMVKVGGGLSRPIPVKRGIRQGCPISGQLYSLSVEPLLCFLRKHLTGFSLPGCITDSPLVVSAYADDINIFVKNENDIHTITKALKCYEKASSSKVNWDKSEALKVGQWREEKIPCLPGGLKWGSNGIKCLGVFLGTQQFQENN